MKENISPQEAIVYSLIHNQGYYKELARPYTDQLAKLLLKEDIAFHADIKEQYRGLIINTIANDITFNLAIPSEDVIIVIEDIDFEEYLK